MSRQDAICYFFAKNSVPLTEADRKTPWKTLSQQPIEKIESILPQLPLDLYPTAEELLEGNRENSIGLFLLMFTLLLAEKNDNYYQLISTVSIILKLIEKCTAEKQIDLLMQELAEKAINGEKTRVRRASCVFYALCFSGI